MALVDYYNTNDDTQYAFGGATWRAQVFTASSNYNIESIKLKIYNYGGSGDTITVSIRAVSGGVPTGSDIDGVTATKSDADIDQSGPGQFEEFVLSAPISLTSGTQYAIIVRGDTLYWRVDGSSPTYSGGTSCYSTNSGSSWTSYSAGDMMFETYSGVAVYDEGTKTVTGQGAVSLASEDGPDDFAEGTKTVSADGSALLASEDFSGDYAEGTKTVSGVGSVSFVTESAALTEGVMAITGVCSVSLYLESLRDTLNWPASRPSDYDPDLIFDEDTGTWVTADGSAGSRLQTNLVAIGQNDTGQGVIYYR
jgi:hypothetical protein